MLTGAPGFPGTDRGGMLGLLPGGGGAGAGVATGLGAAGASGAAIAGAALGTGDPFKRFNASLSKKKINKSESDMPGILYSLFHGKLE